MSEMSEMSEKCETWYRVPRSAEECAVHLEAGGVVEWCADQEWGATTTPAQGFRTHAALVEIELVRYRLVYTTPVGMSPVIGAPGHAYGLAKQAPKGWDVALWADGWGPSDAFPHAIIEARPPAPGPRTEKVPLTKLVGRTLVGETEAVEWIRWACGEWRWGRVRMFAPTNNNTLILPVDVETGMVEVLAEEEA